MQILITRPVPEIALSVLKRGLPTAVVSVLADARPGVDLVLHLTSDTVAILCTLADRLDSAFFTEAAKVCRLKVIATMAAGTNNIAISEASRLGIAVANTPDVTTGPTVETAVGLMLAALRRFGEGERELRAGNFRGWEPLYLRGQPLFGATVGVIGAGRIGQATAQACHFGFGCKILYTGNRQKPDFDAECGARKVELDELLRESDVVTIHCPLTDATRHMIGERELALMKPTAVLVNTARGPVVDEVALADSLKRGVIFAAGLDVFEREPEIHPELLQLESAVLLPHIGSATYATRDKMAEMCADAIVDGLSGRQPRHRVNPL